MVKAAMKRYKYKGVTQQMFNRIPLLTSKKKMGCP
jgi:hypothetical protein